MRVDQNSDHSDHTPCTVAHTKRPAPSRFYLIKGGADGKSEIHSSVYHVSLGNSHAGFCLFIYWFVSYCVLKSKVLVGFHLKHADTMDSHY
jgi:hypothetical protein